jgi:hypothetical protein
MFSYEISGYYFANDERKRFEEIVDARDNTEAMEMVIGAYAWKESLAGNTFKLDTIHYEFLHECL